MKIPVIFILYFSLAGLLHGQETLADLAEETQEKEYVISTFKATRLINGQSVENPGKQELIFIISHRFGRIDNGIYDLFGMDNATIRLGLEYGINERLALGIGRNSYNKTFDGFIKYQLLKQHTGISNLPFSLTLYSNVTANSLRNFDYHDAIKFKHRLSYSNQILLASKLNTSFSLQFMTIHLHNNLVQYSDDPNDMIILGAGGRFMITRRLSLNTEYYYLLNKPEGDFNPRLFSAGFDIETGGHVFQLFFSNTQPHYERAMFTENTSRWLSGDIYFGFNISRTFSL